MLIFRIEPWVLIYCLRRSLKENSAGG